MKQWKAYRLEIIIILLFIFILSLTGCTSQEVAPCNTWACEKQAMRKEVERKCRQLEFRENAELSKIGYKVNYHCPEVAKRMYP